MTGVQTCALPISYEGAPLPVTAVLSATSKAAAFAVILRLFSGLRTDQA